MCDWKISNVVDYSATTLHHFILSLKKVFFLILHSTSMECLQLSHVGIFCQWNESNVKKYHSHNLKLRTVLFEIISFLAVPNNEQLFTTIAEITIDYWAQSSSHKTIGTDIHVQSNIM